jgi:hypothetical protein
MMTMRISVEDKTLRRNLRRKVIGLLQRMDATTRTAEEAGEEKQKLRPTT